MNCPKCKIGTLEESDFDKKIGYCNICKTNFTYSPKRKT